MSVFTIWEAGRNETFVENLRTDTTIQYVDGTTCKLVTKKDWMEIDAPPSLMGFESGGKIRFALQKLLKIDIKYLKSSSTNKTYRGLPANMWLYEMKGTEDNFTAITSIYVYWSNSTWNTTSGVEGSVPLGFKITKIVHKDKPETKAQNINVFAFTEELLNKAAFEAKEGIYCEGDIKSEFPFPSLPKIEAVSIHSEIALAAYLEVKNVDIWYDMKNKLLRIDMDRFGKQEPGYLSPQRRLTSEFTSKEIGGTFEIDMYKGKLTCEVTEIDKYEFEAQDIINPKLDAKYWDVHHFFGVNSTTYRYIGKTVKRNIPCHIFQGLRNDWPEENSGTTSLWEWCLAVKLRENDNPIDFRDKELPLVSAQVYFIKSSDEDFPTGSRLVHHFYDALAEDPNVMYGAAFDVSRCFNQTQRKSLQFTVDAEISASNIHIFENATSDPAFLQQWRDQIYKATKLTLPSLRITKVRSAIYNKVLYITFTLLDVFPQLPANIKKIPAMQVTAADAQKSLSNAIDSGSVQIKYTYDKGKSLDLKAKPKTLVPQVDPTTMVHEKTTVPPPISSKTSPATTSTEPTGTDISVKELPITGHPPGTVAGVSVAMLIVGITLGAGGTFYKYRGLPMWCRRA